MKNVVVCVWICEGNSILKNMQINNIKSLENLEGEIWKDIPEFEGYYQVSNMGRVKSLLRVVEKSNNRKMTFQPKILSLNKHYKNGYFSAYLRVFDKKERKSLHRLVALSFLDSVNNKSEINHIDSDKSNNRFDNLEWVSRRENQSFMGKNKSKTSIYTGVHKPNYNRFIASIYYNGKRITIGSFKTEEEAYQSRKQFELENDINNKYS
jgi:hypothetical protein